MKILVAHNRYQGGRGGEDVVFEAEVDLLRGAGHSVETLTVSNEAINSLAARIATTLSIADNAEGKRAVAEALDRFRPDIVHVHNFFPLLSPAVFDVCRQQRVPAVVTLHNYRTICTGGMLLRDGRICHKCLDRGHLWGVAHRCYRGSLPGSLASAYMIARHQRRGTWTRPGVRLIALTQFARTLFTQAGFDAGRIDVKPNFMADPGAPDPAMPRTGLLYVGRLSREKGVGVLLDAVAGAGMPLRIVGEGQERGNGKTEPDYARSNRLRQSSSGSTRVDGLEQPQILVRRVALEIGGPCSLPPCRCEMGRAQKLNNPLSEPCRIGRRHHSAGLAGAHHLGKSADLGCNDGRPLCKGFDHDHRKPLVP